MVAMIADNIEWLSYGLASSCMQALGGQRRSMTIRLRRISDGKTETWSRAPVASDDDDDDGANGVWW